MKAYVKEKSDNRIVEKYLVSLPRKFDFMVSIIEKTKDIARLGEELMGILERFMKEE